MKDEEPDLDKDFVINNIYKIQYEMGKGGYGKVYLVQNIKDGKNYALKVLSAKKDKEKHKQDFLKEINIIQELNKLNDSYILKIYNFGKFIAKNIERLYYIMDYAEKEDLLHYITVNHGLGEEYDKILFKKILEGIQFCHKNNYCHFDIKVTNILLNKKFNPIIIDFGLSQPIKYSDKDELIPYKGKRGTPFNECPQMFEHEKTYNGIDADIFALGVLLFHLVLGLHCFSSAIGHSYQNIKNKKYDDFWNSKPQTVGVSKEFKNLFVQMVAYNPEERPKIEDILTKDPWLLKYKNSEDEYVTFMNQIEQKIKDANQPKIQAPNKDKGEEKQTTKGISFDNKKNFFINLTPKKIKERRSYKYCLKIIGYIEPNDFMNLLVTEIIKSYELECLVNADKEKLKFTITFPKEYEENEIDDTDEEEVEDISRDCKMKVKLYDGGINEYLLCFVKDQGYLEDFYDNFLKIKEIVKSIVNNL